MWAAVSALPLLLGVGIPGFVYDVARIVAAFLGAVGGWFVAAPLARTVSRVVFRRPLAEGGQLLSRVAGAGLAAILILVFFPTGSGPGGGGLGEGGGKGNEKGSGETGHGKKKGTPSPGDSKDNGKNGDTAKGRLLIEVLGGKRVKELHKSYLLDRKEPAVKLDQVRAFLEANGDKYKDIDVIITDDTNEDFANELKTMLLRNFQKFRVHEVDQTTKEAK
jgi:hypothetical protein